VDDVIFSYNGENRPESRTTCMFHPVRQVVALGQSLLSLTTSSFVIADYQLALSLLISECINV